MSCRTRAPRCSLSYPRSAAWWCLIGVYLAVSAGHADGGDGWAAPTATDIAFALAVLAVVGQNLPSVLRAFLLTLAVVDDLGAIIIIAVAYTAKIDTVALAIAAVLVASMCCNGCGSPACGSTSR